MLKKFFTFILFFDFSAALADILVYNNPIELKGKKEIILRNMEKVQIVVFYKKGGAIDHYGLHPYRNVDEFVTLNLPVINSFAFDKKNSVLYYTNFRYCIKTICVDAISENGLYAYDFKKMELRKIKSNSENKAKFWKIDRADFNNLKLRVVERDMNQVLSKAQDDFAREYFEEIAKELEVSKKIESLNLKN